MTGIVSALLVSAVVGGLVLAERGRPAACSVVVPAKATPVQRYAAEELQKWTERLTDVRMPIVARGDRLPDRAVVIEDGGGANPAEDGFRLCADGNRLRIVAAADRGGSLYGVYELLERFGGCRCYSSWCERIPRISRFAVPGTLDETHVPAFAMRQTWWYDFLQHLDFAARLRMNTRQWGRMDEKYGGEKASRMYLHSEKLRFRHPKSGEWLEFKSDERGILRH